MTMTMTMAAFNNLTNSINSFPIDISFRAVCYGKIEHTEWELKDNTPNTIKQILANPTYRKNLLEKFLLSFKPDELFINRTLHQGKKELETDKTLYNSSIGRYDGAVGVISKRNFEITTTELLKDDTKKKSRNRYYAIPESTDLIFKFNINLIISTKFDKEKPYFLSTLLLRNDIKFNESCVPANNDNIFDYLLVILFKHHLKKALIKGFYKTYRDFENNDYKIKGSIDINRYIKYNIWLEDGRMPYKYRENSYYNPLNQLILETYKVLKRKHAGVVRLNIDNNHEIHKALEMLSSINGKSNNNILQNNSKKITHPYYHEYEELRRICLIVLKGNSISPWNGKDNDSLQGFLFYVPDLWELFLEECFTKKLVDKNIRVLPQGGKEGIRVLSRTKKDKKYRLQTYPDFVFEKTDDNNKKKNKANTKRCILDAKFKDGWDGVANLSKTSGSFILDDYTKCIRDMNTVSAGYTGVIYPTMVPYPIENDNTVYFPDNNVEHKISKYNNKDTFWIFPVSIPEVNANTSFSAWQKIFADNIDIAMEAITAKIEAIQK